MIGSVIKGFAGGRWSMIICFETPDGKRGMVYQYPMDGEPHGGYPVMEDDWDIDEYDEEADHYGDNEMELYLGGSTFKEIWDAHVK